MINISITSRPRTTSSDTPQLRTTYATSSTTATEATHAQSADEATHAQSADEALHATSADEAKHADNAQHAQKADIAHDLDQWDTADTRYLSRTHDDTASGNITHLGQVTHQAPVHYATDIQSTTYQPDQGSFDGTSWQLHQDPTTHAATLTADHLRIRGTLTAYELIIRQVRALCGSLGITQACGRIRSVDLTSGRYSYHIHLEGDPIHGYGGFQPGDYIRCQRHTATGIRGYWVQIESTSNGGETLHILRTQFAHTIHIGQGASDYDTSITPYPLITADDTATTILADDTTYTLTTDDNAIYDADEANNATSRSTPMQQCCLPAPGDEIVQYGSATDPTRRTAIYIHTDGDGTPAIDLLQGITAKTFAGTLRMRIGGTLPDGGFGLYVRNGTIISQSDDGHIDHYALRPDGSFQLGCGAIEYNPTDGHITLGLGVEVNWKQVTPPTTTWSQISARPDWLTTWQGQTTTAGATYVAAKSAFFGSRNDDNPTTYTGILMSADPITLGTNANARGLLAIHRDQARVIIDPVSETYQFHGNILAESGQISGLHVGLSLNGITTITADNFATHFPTHLGADFARYIPNYYLIAPVIIFASIPTLTATTLRIQLPPTDTTDEARLFSYAFLGKTLHIINQTDTTITLYSANFQSLADYLKGSLNFGGGTYTLKPSTSISLTAHLATDGTIYWVYEATNGLTPLPSGTITPILPPSANKSWTTDYNNNSGSAIS